MMGDIYLRAENVFASLGMHEEASSTFTAIVRTLEPHKHTGRPEPLENHGTKTPWYMGTGRTEYLLHQRSSSPKTQKELARAFE